LRLHDSSIVLAEQLAISGAQGQAVRAVAAYLDRNPAELHCPFEELALKALREAWPCRN
jgi:hypothetical protein